LYAALVLSLAATFGLAFLPDDADAPPAARDAQTRPAPPATNTASARAPRVATPWPEPPKARDASPWLIGNDALAGWAAPTPPPAPPPPVAPRVPDASPVVPSAPAFPYQLIGRLEGDGPPTALLNSPLRTLSVKAQDTIDGQWR
ncbi:unnamed protein product, partial [Phaeothamnion confervicola]